MSEKTHVACGLLKIMFGTNDSCYPSLGPPLLERAEECLHVLPQVQRQREM